MILMLHHLMVRKVFWELFSAVSFGVPKVVQQKVVTHYILQFPKEHDTLCSHVQSAQEGLMAC